MSETKECNQCHVRKELSEFTLLDKISGKLHPSCKECKYYPKPKDGTTNKKCIDCGEFKHYKNDFPSSNACCKPCFVIRKNKRDAEKKVIGTNQAQLPFKSITPEPEPEPVQECKRCGEIRPLSDYHVNNKNKCKHCVQELKSEKMENVNTFLKNKWQRAKDRAKKDNIEFAIESDQVKYKYWVINRGECALTGIHMTHKLSPKLGDEKEKFPFNISIDRIDSTKGYTYENIQLVCWCVNSAKSDMDQDDFIQMCGKVWEYQNKPKEPHWTPSET